MFRQAAKAEYAATHVAELGAWPRETPLPRLSWLWTAGVAAGILYGSLIPFDIRPAGLQLDGASSVLRLRFVGASTEDIITNLLVYVPLGLAIVLCGAGASRSGWRRVPLAAVGGAILSLLAETLQTGIASRVGSWLDVALNTLGAAGGAALGAAGGTIAARVTRHLRRALLERPLALYVSALTIGLLLYGLAPFDFVTDTDGLYRAFGRSRLDLSTPRPVAFGDPPLALLVSQLCGAFWFTVLGYLLAVAGRAAGRHPLEAVGSAVKHGVTLAVLIELMQLFTCSHGFDLASLVLRVLAVALGAWGSALLPHGTGVSDRNQCACMAPTGLFAAFAVIQVLGLLASSAQPDLWSFEALSPDRVQWMPFHAMWTGSTSSAVSEVLSSVVTYGVLALTLITVLKRSRVNGGAFVAGAVTALAAASAETLRAFDLTKVPDLTGPVLAAISTLVAWRLHVLLYGAVPARMSSM